VLYVEHDMLTLSEHLISPLVFIVVYVNLLLVSPYFLDFEFCLIAWYLYIL